MRTKYVTVFNKYTKRPVPYRVLPNGEIQITSADPFNNEDTCIIKVTEVFHEYSHDIDGWPGRIG